MEKFKNLYYIIENFTPSSNDLYVNKIIYFIESPDLILKIDPEP